MHERGRLDLAVEALVIQPKFAGLFGNHAAVTAVIGPIVAPFLLAVTNVSLKGGGLRRLDA